MKTPETKTIIEVGGVFLTEDAINELKSFQTNGNNGIDENQEALLSSIVILSNVIKTLEGDELKRVTLTMHNLSGLHKSLKKLKKP